MYLFRIQYLVGDALEETEIEAAEWRHQQCVVAVIDNRPVQLGSDCAEFFVDVEAGEQPGPPVLAIPFSRVVMIERVRGDD